VLGDPGGHLGVVTAASLGGAHGDAGREQLLDDVVAHVPFGCRLIRRLSSVQFGLAWPSRRSSRARARWADRCSVFLSSRGAGLSCGLCRGAAAGRVALDRQGPGHWRLDPRMASGLLPCRTGHHGFIPPSGANGTQGPTALVGRRMSPIVVLKFSIVGADQRYS